MPSTKFPLGQVVATPGAISAIEQSGQTPAFFVAQHAAGDWGVVGGEDRLLNDASLKDGSRLLSAYRTLKNVTIWIITEAADDNGRRAATTILLPEDY